MKPFITAFVLCMATTAGAQAQVGMEMSRNGRVAMGAISGGHEANGETLYLCTAPYAGGYHPGKLRPGFGGCNIGYGGSEYTVSEYDVLTGYGQWAGATGGNVPGNAIQAGAEANGTPLFACRAWHAGGLHPGKVRPGFNGCNIGYGGSEISIHSYDVLVQ